MTERENTRRGRRTRGFSLAKEWACYQAHLSDWLSDHEDEFVLIQGDEVYGFFETRDDALSAGYARFGVVPLFVKQVRPDEPTHNIPNIIL
jgi:hypothetical protein